MKATPLEFRFRFYILAAIYFLGFVAPWDYWLHADSIRTWQLLASWPARSGWLSFNAATIVVLLVGIIWALKGAILRTWGTAYLSPSVVQDHAMHGEGIIAAGPFRYVRNPAERPMPGSCREPRRQRRGSFSVGFSAYHCP